MTKVLIVECMELGLSQGYEVGVPYDAQFRELDLGGALDRILSEGTAAKTQSCSAHRLNRSSSSTQSSSSSSTPDSSPSSTHSDLARNSSDSRRSLSASEPSLLRPNTSRKRAALRRSRSESARGPFGRCWRRSRSGGRSPRRTPRSTSRRGPN